MKGGRWWKGSEIRKGREEIIGGRGDKKAAKLISVRPFRDKRKRKKWKMQETTPSFFSSDRTWRVVSVCSDPRLNLKAVNVGLPSESDRLKGFQSKMNFSSRSGSLSLFYKNAILSLASSFEKKQTWCLRSPTKSYEANFMNTFEFFGILFCKTWSLFHKVWF